MGGIGSGRRDQIRTTAPVESATCIDIRAVNRKAASKLGHWLKLETSEESSFYTRVKNGVLQIAQLEPSETHLYGELVMEELSRHFGGHQSYLLCPTCRRRFCILYLRIPKEIGCRKCLNLSYESQYSSNSARYLIEANKLRNRLLGRADRFQKVPGKPKHMHWSTYWKLISQIAGLEAKHDQHFNEYKASALNELTRLGRNSF